MLFSTQNYINVVIAVFEDLKKNLTECQNLPKFSFAIFLKQ